MKIVRLLIGCAVPVVAIGGWTLYAMHADPPPGPMGETDPIPSIEATYTARIVASGINMLNAVQKTVGDGVYRRDAHARTNACALASFTVNAPEERFRRGLFATAKEYKAWIRFSAGSTGMEQAWKPDAHGMAVKVLGVPGAKLLEGEENDTTQDFLMIDNPAFFIANVEEYALFTHYQELGRENSYFLSGERDFTWNIFHWRLRELRIGLNIKKFPIHNLLGSQYHSMTAYKLGAGQYVKYSWKPVPCAPGGSLPSRWAGLGANTVGEKLRADITSGPGYCFDFLVQPQVQGKNMPVEDPTIEWSGNDSAFVPVARLKIISQDLTPQFKNGFCENLSFTPWHALPEHEPVGGLNRVRKGVYEAISRYRRCENGKKLGEPFDDGSPNFKGKACDATQPIPTL